MEGGTPGVGNPGCGVKFACFVQEMSMYEQYIMGMLTNFEAGLPLDRIHNMLKMFVPDQAYDKNIEQLASFLGQLVADEKLLNSGNVYTKPA